MRPPLISVFVESTFLNRRQASVPQMFGVEDTENKWNIATFNWISSGSDWILGAAWTHAYAEWFYCVFAQKNDNQFGSGVKPEVNAVSMNVFIIIIQKQAGAGSNLERT